MTGRPEQVLPFAAPGSPVRFVVLDDEPRYRVGLGAPPEAMQELGLDQVGGYGDLETFLALHRRPCHVVVLDLCLDRRTGDAAVLQGVRAVHRLSRELGYRVLVHTADSRPEPVARCVAAGAVGYVSKYDADPWTLATAVAEIGRGGRVNSPCLTMALKALVARCRDVRLSYTLEATLVLLDRGMSDAEVAARRHLSVRTVEDHKRKILEVFGADMEAHRQGFAELARDLGVIPGDLVNDLAGSRPTRGTVRAALGWARESRRAS